MNTTSKAKVIMLPGSYLGTRKQRPLSKLMITTLVKACRKQPKGIPFGQQDLDGSFSALVSRDLIKHKINEYPNTTWFVTDEAVEILNKLGILVSC